jgi:O-antigen/teichoic acid export membrane protein
MGLMACALYFHLQGVPQAAKAFLIAALFFPVIYTARNYYLYLTAHQRFKEEFVCQSFVELGTVLAVAVAVLFLDANLLYIVLLMLGFQAASYTYLFYRFTRDIGSDETDEELIEYGWFLTAFEGLLHISHYIDRCSIGLFLSPGALAMYSIAKLPHSAPRRLSRTVFNVFFPRFAANEEGLSTKKVLFVLGGSALVMIAVVLVLPFAMGVLFPTYQEAVLYGQLLSLTILPVPLNALFGYYFRAKKRRRAIRLALGASGGLSILFTLPALYFAGVMGIVVVQLSREFLVFGCYMLCFFGERGGVRHAPQG